MNRETYEQGSERLREELREIRPEAVAGFLETHREELIGGARPFMDYMGRKFREKGLLRQNVFLAADISESYGYKLLTQEKRTRQRDVILRLCLAARFTAEEVREALILYGMAPLHARVPRDAVLLSALYHGVCELDEVNRLLESCDQPPLVEGYK